MLEIVNNAAMTVEVHIFMDTESRPAAIRRDGVEGWVRRVKGLSKE